MRSRRELPFDDAIVALDEELSLSDEAKIGSVRGSVRAYMQNWIGRQSKAWP